MTLKEEDVRKDIISSLFFIVLGLFVIFISLRMSIWKASVPHEGFMPLALGTLMSGLGISLLVSRIVRNKINENIGDGSAADKEKDLIEIVKSQVIEEDTGSDDEKVDLKRLYKYLMAILLYVILLETFGYLLTTGLFFMAIVKFVEKKGYFYSLLITVVVVSLSFLLFGILLRVPLPPGILKYLKG
jgi:putative tricarboxylic transport membrane protein